MPLLARVRVAELPLARGAPVREITDLLRLLISVFAGIAIAERRHLVLERRRAATARHQCNVFSALLLAADQACGFELCAEQPELNARAVGFAFHAHAFEVLAESVVVADGP